MPLPIQFNETPQQIELIVGERRLSLQNSDILELTADALVCPIDPNLDFRSGLARVISQAAGKHVGAQRPLTPEPYGKVVVLPGGKLNVRYIFLSVILGERGLEKMKTSIQQAVERSIRYAEFLRLKSIAFPVLGCARSNPPYNFVAYEMLRNAIKYFQRRNTKINAIFFSVLNPQAYEAFRKEAKEITDLL